jgi:C-terminal processing protease CtpA/Prc
MMAAPTGVPVEFTFIKEAISSKCGIVMESTASGITTVMELRPGSLGEKCGLLVGSRIMCVNNTPITHQGEAASILREATGEVTITAMVPCDGEGDRDALLTEAIDAAGVEVDIQSMDADTLVAMAPMLPGIVAMAAADDAAAEKPLNKKELNLQRSESFGRRMLKRAASFGHKPRSTTSASDSSINADGDTKLQRSESFARRALRRAASFSNHRHAASSPPSPSSSAADATAKDARAARAAAHAAMREKRKRREHEINIERIHRNQPLDCKLVDVPGVGVVVSEIDDDSDVAIAGLKAGDSIVAVNSSVVADAAEFNKVLTRILGTVELRVTRLVGGSAGAKGWKSATDAESGRTMFWKMEKENEGEGWVASKTYQNPKTAPKGLIKKVALREISAPQAQKIR